MLYYKTQHAYNFSLPASIFTPPAISTPTSPHTNTSSPSTSHSRFENPPHSGILGLKYSRKASVSSRPVAYTTWQQTMSRSGKRRAQNPR